MKFMLIALNVLLVAAVAHLAWTYSSEPLTFASTSKKFSPSKLERKRAIATVKRVEKHPLDSPEVTEQKIAALMDHNIFKTERVPEAPANKNAQRNNQQIRADMSLVGTYVIGDSLGAIILQRLQGNSQQQLKALQQKEYEQYALSSNRITDPKKKAAAASESGVEESVAVVDEKKDAKEGQKDPKQIVIVGGSPSISANNVFRQHLKVGDTTVNGYKLEEVTRTSAVLTKNSERIELTLLTPSEAGNVTRQTRNNNNNNNQNKNNNNNQNNKNNNNRNQQNNNNRNNNNNNRNNNNNNNWNRNW